MTVGHRRWEKLTRFIVRIWNNLVQVGPGTVSTIHREFCGVLGNRGSNITGFERSEITSIFNESGREVPMGLAVVLKEFLLLSCLISPTFHIARLKALN